jgi:hypothetical protein
MNTQEMIAVMQAFEDGKRIQIDVECTGLWQDCAFPAWNWRSQRYRVKPEPLTLYCIVDENGCVMDTDSSAEHNYEWLAGWQELFPDEKLRLVTMIEKAS